MPPLRAQVPAFAPRFLRAFIPPYLTAGLHSSCCLSFCSAKGTPSLCVLGRLTCHTPEAPRGLGAHWQGGHQAWGRFTGWPKGGEMAGGGDWAGGEQGQVSWRWPEARERPEGRSRAKEE